jgi:dGTPase
VSGGKLVELNSEAVNQITMLKQLTWHYVILNTDLATVQHGQKKLVRTVFNHFYDAATGKIDSKILPRYYEERVQGASAEEQLRLAADCVSGMTEAEVSKIYKQLTGYKVGPIL